MGGTQIYPTIVFMPIPGLAVPWLHPNTISIMPYSCDTGAGCTALYCTAMYGLGSGLDDWAAGLPPLDYRESHQQCRSLFPLPTSPLSRCHYQGHPAGRTSCSTAPSIRVRPTPFALLFTSLRISALLSAVAIMNICQLFMSPNQIQRLVIT